MNVDLFACLRLKFACRSQMVFHIPATQGATRINIFEATEDLGQRSPNYMDHHIQAPPMAHRKDDPFGIIGCDAFQQLPQ